MVEKLSVLRQFRNVVIANFFGCSVEEYVAVIRVLEEAEGLAAYELNVSCPNTARGGIQFGSDPSLLGEVVLAGRKAARRPLWVKLSPNVTDITAGRPSCRNRLARCSYRGKHLSAMSIDVRPGNPGSRPCYRGFRPGNCRLRCDWSKPRRAVRVPSDWSRRDRKAEDVLEYLIAAERLPCRSERQISHDRTLP